MTSFSLSMRATISGAIVLMGLVGLVLALLTGQAYRYIAIENQRGALKELLALEARDKLAELVEHAERLGLALQKEPRFRRLFEERDVAAMAKVLDQPFHQYFVTARVLKLERVYAFDRHLRLIASSEQGSAELPRIEPVCTGMLQRAEARNNAERIKVFHELCLHQGIPLYSVLVPVGGLSPIGYLQVVTDPSFSLRSAEEALGMPIRLTRIDKRETFRSDRWPSGSPDSVLISAYTLVSPDGDPALVLHLARDIHNLNEKLTRTRYLVMATVSAITWLLLLVMLRFVDRTALSPLRQLAQQLRLLHKDKTHLGEQVGVKGNREVQELARDFNAMTLELKDLYGRLEQMAFTDPLTALPNRSKLHELLEVCTGASERQDAPFALLMMDLDRFKEVNDTLGHHAGDMLLQQVSSRLESVLRKTDVVARVDQESMVRMGPQTVARLGGDEFAAILPRVSKRAEAERVAKKILDEMQRPFDVNGHSFTVGVSIGVALCPTHGTDGYTLMRLADVAMYQAKVQGLGYSFYDKTVDHHSVQQLTLESQLRHAIEAGELEVHYQPQVDMNTRKICAVEALVRWRHPDRGLLPPDSFVPMAEQTGLIRPLTEWVLDTALADCAAWQALGCEFPVNVNVSARSLFDKGLIENVRAALARWGVPSGRVTLELTESAVMTDPRKALEILATLDLMGVGLAIDDFGTGYSSLLYLKRLPVDEIKIDRSFVTDMLNDRNDAVIVRSTIDLAHNMGLRVVAEGVEDEGTWQALDRLGCDVAQGFHIAVALNREEFDRWLKESPWSPLTTPRSTKQKP